MGIDGPSRRETWTGFKQCTSIIAWSNFTTEMSKMYKHKYYNIPMCTISGKMVQQQSDNKQNLIHDNIYPIFHDHDLFEACR